MVSLQSRWIMLKICQLHIFKADEPSAPGRVSYKSEKNPVTKDT